MVNEPTLCELVTELRAINLVKRQRIQWMLRCAYGNHYCRMVPPLLRFRSMEWWLNRGSAGQIASVCTL